MCVCVYVTIRHNRSPVYLCVLSFVCINEGNPPGWWVKRESVDYINKPVRVRSKVFFVGILVPLAGWWWNGNDVGKKWKINRSEQNHSGFSWTLEVMRKCNRAPSGNTGFMENRINRTHKKITHKYLEPVGSVYWFVAYWCTWSRQLVFAKMSVGKSPPN